MQHNNIQVVGETYMCSNCGACVAVCPKDAIDFKHTNIGRMYAEVSDQCINCGLCTKVCPSLDANKLNQKFVDPFVGDIDSVYIGRSTNTEVYKNAQSGGICTALLTYLFDEKLIDGALVVRMNKANPVPQLQAIIVTNTDELKQTQKSCYTPIDVLSSLKDITKYNSLAIVGLPCHISGLTNLQMLKKEYADKIKYKIGLKCDRTLCGTIQNVFKTYTPHFQAIKIAWRCKSLLNSDLHLRYENAPVVIFNEDGKWHKVKNTHRFALKEMFTPPRCRVCHDKINVHADIVLGDPWGMAGYDKEHGDSVIVVRTEIGKKLWSDAIEQGYVKCIEKDKNDVVIGQSITNRRKQTAVYSKVLDEYGYTLHFNQDCTQQYSDIEYKEAKSKIDNFFITENLAITSIISLAKKQIRTTEFRSALNSFILVRIMRKIKNILSK